MDAPEQMVPVVENRLNSLRNHHQLPFCLLRPSDLLSTGNKRGANMWEKNSGLVVTLATFQCCKGNSEGIDKICRPISPREGCPILLHVKAGSSKFDGCLGDWIIPPDPPWGHCGQNSSVRSFGIQRVSLSGSTVRKKQRGAGHSLCLTVTWFHWGKEGGGGNAQRNQQTKEEKKDPANTTVMDPYVTPWEAVMMVRLLT